MALFPSVIELSSLDGTNGFKLSGAAAYDFSGFPVVSAGDINGDGIGDLIIGAEGSDPHGDYSGMWCSAAPPASPPTSSCRASTAATVSSSAAWPQATSPGSRPHPPATSTVTASPTSSS